MVRVSVKKLQQQAQSSPPSDSRTAAESDKSASVIPEIDAEDDTETVPASISRDGSSPAPTPLPPVFKFDTDYPRGQRPNDFFRYWSELAPEFQSRLMAYVYRNWPHIQIMMPDRRKGGLKPSCQIDKRGGSFPIRDLDELTRTYGSGDYTIRLNDAANRVRLALCLIRGIRAEDFPPSVPKNMLDVLVMDDPVNGSYIDDLRFKGILQDKEREGQDMAASEAMNTLAETVKEMATQKKEPAQQQTPAEVTIKTLEMAGKAFDQGVTLTKETMAAQADAKVAEAKANLAGTQQNPTQAIGFIKELAEVIQKLQPPAAAALTMPAPNSGDMLKELTGIFTTFMDREAKLQGTILTLQSTRMETLEKQLQALMLNPATPAAQKESLSTSLDTLIGMKDKLETLFGSKGEAEDSQAPVKLPGWVHALQTVASVIPNAMAAGVAMTHNLAVARTGQGAPISAGTVESETPPLLPNPTPQPTSTAQDGAGVIPPDAMDFLNEIREPFLRYLNDPEKTGVEFAQLVKNYLGDIKYQGAREAGKDTLLILLRLYPPTAAVVKSIPERTAEFVDDFVNAEEILAAEDADEDGQEQPGNVRTFVAPAEGAAEVVDVPPVVLNQEGARKRKPTV